MAPEAGAWWEEGPERAVESGWRVNAAPYRALIKRQQPYGIVPQPSRFCRFLIHIRHKAQRIGSIIEYEGQLADSSV